MNCYFAPLESITSYPLRNTHAHFFPETDKYFSPFVSANEEGSYSGRIARDLSPTNNEKLYLVPQLMGKNPKHMLEVFKYLQNLGYQEVNLNLGCPSGTVVAKGKGAGMLRNLTLLEEFFNDIFSSLPSGLSISVKTRIGISDSSETEDIFLLFNAFPFSEMIVHPRLQKQFYKGNVDLDSFRKICSISKHKLIYNGDIENIVTAIKIRKEFPEICGIMLGRGLLSNPALVREIKGGLALQEEEFKDYISAVEDAFSKEIAEDRNLLAKLKECWTYFSKNYPGSVRGIKELRKAKNMAEYRSAKYRIYSESSFYAYRGEKEWI